jgi:tetratricopeptide (TPR) repeat protein
VTEPWQPILEQLQAIEDTATLPSLLTALEDALPLKTPLRAQVLMDIGKTLSAQARYPEAQRYLERAFEEARKLESSDLQALAMGLQADIHRMQGDFRSAHIKLMQARETLDDIPAQDRAISARIYLLSGLNSLSLGNYDIARQQFYEAYQRYNQVNDLEGKAFAANRLGTVATMLGVYSEAEKYLQQSLALARQIGDRHAMAGALLNLGEIARLQEKFTEARAFYQEASALFAALGLHRGMCIAENNLGHIYVQQADLSAAKYHYLRAVECAKMADLVPDMLDTLAGLVFILLSRERYDLAAFSIAFILQHPAHLQETEQFLEPAQASIKEHAQFEGVLPSPERLLQVVEDMLAEVFSI